MPDRREQIVVALMLCHALSREEAEHFLRMYDAGQARENQRMINEIEEPKVFHLPLKWWRMGKAAALYTVIRDVTSAHLEDENYNEKGHRER